jgi:hypothetical protein
MPDSDSANDLFGSTRGGFRFRYHISCWRRLLVFDSQPYLLRLGDYYRPIQAEESEARSNLMTISERKTEPNQAPL